jgi:hypothetical protein
MSAYAVYQAPRPNREANVVVLESSMQATTIEVTAVHIGAKGSEHSPMQQHLPLKEASGKGPVGLVPVRNINKANAWPLCTDQVSPINDREQRRL